MKYPEKTHLETESTLVFGGLRVGTRITCKWAQEIWRRGVDANVLKLDCGAGCTTLNLL